MQTRLFAIIRDTGSEAIYVQTDVTTLDNAERMVQETLNNYGKLDILVSSAGIAMRLPVCRFAGSRLASLSKC